MKILFIGGPGNISSGAIPVILNRDDKLAIFTLPETETSILEDKVKFYKGTRDSRTELETALEDFRPDVVIDFVCFSPSQCEDTCKALKGKIKQYILVSTVDVYGYPLSQLPMTESGQFRTPITRYAQDKWACELVTRQFPELNTTVVRPAYSMGHGFVLTPISHLGGRQLIPRLRKGLPIFSPGDGTTLLHASVAQNTGAMIATLAGQEKAYSKAYNCAHEYVISHDMYFGLFAKALGVTPNIVHIPTDFVIHEFPEEFNHTMLSQITQYNLAFSVDRFKCDFPDFRWEVSLDDFIHSYIEYCDNTGILADPQEKILDDIIIEHWKKMLEKR